MCIGSIDGRLYAVDGTSGKQRWRYPLKGRVRVAAAPAVGPERGRTRGQPGLFRNIPQICTAGEAAATGVRGIRTPFVWGSLCKQKQADCVTDAVKEWGSSVTVFPYR